MSLQFTVKPGESFVIGSALLKNPGKTAITLENVNDEPMIPPDKLAEIYNNHYPAGRIRELILNMLLFPNEVEKRHREFWRKAEKMIKNIPNTKELFDSISCFILKHNYHVALTETEKLIQMEAALMRSETKRKEN